MLVSLGVSFHDADLATVERFAAAEGLRDALFHLPETRAGGIDGVVPVTTCNRLEVYLDLRRFHDGVEAATRAVAGATGRSADEVAGLLQVRVDMEVAEHLFRVASGLDSMVVGEAQISGQVSEALGVAQDAGHVTSELNLLFQSAAHVAKQIAAETELHAAGRSIAAAALDMARAASPLTADQWVLLIGTGAYARVVTAALLDRGQRKIAVYSQSGRQGDFAAARGLTPIDRGALPDMLATCGLVVTCSGLPRRALDRPLVEGALARRRGPLHMVDLALQRDVSRDVRDLDLVDVIDLRSVAQTPDNAPTGAITAAQALVDSAVLDFEHRLADRQLSPAIVALRTRVTDTIDREVAKLLPRIPPDAANEVQRTAHRIARALLHTPTTRAKEVARSGRANDYIRALHTLFGIEIPGGQANPRPDETDPGRPREV